jgi:tRNA wybutosine-synthesizing protein 5
MTIQDEKYYLRSLGEDPRTDVADLRRDFPELCEDIRLPNFFRADDFFSSVFRISSHGVQLWTHYDVSIINVFLEQFLHIGILHTTCKIFE